MVARYLSTTSRFGVLLAGAALALPSLLSAQTPVVIKAPEKDASQIMVTAFKSSEKGPKSIGGQAAEEMRSRLERDFSARQLYVIPKEKINPNLEASGFSITEALGSHDARALAGMLRADGYISGTVAKTGTGVKVESEYVMARDVSLRQPLGSTESPKLGDAIAVQSKELKESFKQLDGEKKCTNFARNKQYPEAIAAAKVAIAAYPKATLARICEMSVLDVSGAKPEDVLAVAREIVAIDPRSNPGLRMEWKEFVALKQNDSTGVVLVKLLATDPTNATLAGQVIASLLEMRNLDFAAPIVDTAIANNPGDPDILKFRWNILYATKKYKEMYAQGEELAKLDTGFTDSTYFARTAQAYASDSLPQKSAETLAKALVKYPGNAFFTGFEIQQLQRAGQQQQALDLLDKANAAKIPVADAGTMRLLMLRDLKRNDEVIPAVRTLIAAGDTSANLRAILFAQLADNQTADLAKATTPADSVTVFRNSLALLAYADSSIAPKTAQKAEVQFRMGGANVQIVQPLLKQALAEKNCALIKEAKNHLVDAQIMLPQGGSFSPGIMQQLMKSAMQLDPYTDQLGASIKCK